MPTQNFEGLINAVLPNQLIGDQTAGRALRKSRIKIDNGTDANTLKITITSEWNGDAVTVVDNVAKNAITGVFSLDVNGLYLTWLNTGISGDCVAVISANIDYNASGAALTVYAGIDANGIMIIVRNNSTGAALSIPTLVDTGIIYIQIAYLTSG